MKPKVIKSVGKCHAIHISKRRKIVFALDVSRLLHKFSKSNGMSVLASLHNFLSINTLGI